MLENQSQDGQSSTFFSNALHHAGSLFTPKRVGYTVAGAFVFAGAATALYATTPADQLGGQSSVRNSSIFKHTSSSSAADTEPTGDSASGNNTSSTVSSSTNIGRDGVAKVQVNVNGQDMTVPASGTTQSTTTTANGDTTTVTISNNSTTQGTASNGNSSNFSLDVHSSSSSTGGPTNQ